jgi:tetratricopeptide (TPR) repeat protein
MSCLDENTVAELLGSSLKGEALQAAERHVEECAECRALVAAVVRGERDPAETTFPSAVAGRESLARGSLISRYAVLEAIGAGGMGIVYSAYDPVLERKVALKLVRAGGDTGALEEVKVRLLREGKSIAQLAHPNIVAVHDMGTSDDQVFIAMELVDGGSLKQWLKQQKRSWPEVVEKFLAAGEGLAAAHRARLVHRDFKPENVLVGNDGRVRVTDFGLARSSDAPPSAQPSLGVPLEALDPRVTRTGAMLGTPAYMSPEQRAGKGADALSDQFSFCVALWESIYAERPYAPNTWKLAEPLAAGVPPFLRRALTRGLSVDPQDRYPQMEDLLAALAANPQRARRRRLRIGAAFSMVLATAGLSWWAITRSDRLCKSALEQVGAVWNPPLKQSLQAAFAATGRPDAKAQWDLAQRGLELWWQAWGSTRTEACEATRVRGEQSDQILGLRMACLDRRREETRALLDLFQHADGDVVAKAPEAIDALTSVRSCSDVEALLAPVPPPTDPVGKTRLEQLRAKLGESKVRFDAGKYPAALALSSEAALAAKGLGYRPAIAEALLLQGRQQEHLGDLKLAEQTLLDAIVAAEAGRHDEITARAATHLMLVLGARQARYSEAQTWGKLAEGAIGRLGGSAELQARLFKSQGLVLYAQGQVTPAIEHQQRALALLEKLEPNSLSLAETLNDLGAALRGGGKPKEALAAFERALSILVQKVGADSDLIATTRNGIGNVYMLEGRFDEAFGAYRQALEIFEKTLGPTHFRTVTTLNNLGVVLAEQSRFADALPYFERVLEARRTTLKETDSKLADAQSNVAMLLVELGRYDDALAHFEKAKEILQGYPLDHFSQSEYLLGFAKIHLARAAPQKAVDALERVLALCEKKEGFRFDYTRARANFLLGKALWNSKLERPRALSLANAARDALVQFGRERFRRDLAEIEGWLAAHPAAK